MQTDFKVGDTVRLRSGGPLMTIDRILERGDVSCTWFAGGKAECRPFAPRTLEHEEYDQDET
ncbi:MAG: DUF2158 domain-containing protein [Nannocystaceae bacterium]